MRSSRPLLAALLAGTVCFGAVPLAHAAFFGSATATSTFTAAQLAPPTDLVATKRCAVDLLGVLVSAALELTWTPSASDWATGQRLVVTDASGVVIATQDLSASASSTSVDLPLVDTGPYTATVTASYSSWTSVAATASSPGC